MCRAEAKRTMRTHVPTGSWCSSYTGRRLRLAVLGRRRLSCELLFLKEQPVSLASGVDAVKQISAS